MKNVYIPKGESRSYEYLVADNLIVHGHLNVVNGIKAKHISGHGVITAGTVYGDIITADEIETSTVVCRRLLAKRIIAAEVFASDCAVVSCFLSTAYVETGKLTAALSEIDEIKADEVIHLRPNKHGMLRTLLLSALRSFWLALTLPAAKAEDGNYGQVDGVPAERKEAKEREKEEDALREEIGRIVRESLAEQASQKGCDGDFEDFELKRLISTFKLLRTQGYTLRVVPGTPEENAPVFDFEKEELIRPAA